LAPTRLSGLCTEQRIDGRAVTVEILAPLSETDLTDLAHYLMHLAGLASAPRPLTEALARSGTGLCGFLLPITGRSIRDQAIKQLLCGAGYVVDSAGERRFVRLGGMGEAAHLADELQRSGLDFQLGGRRLEIM
jgi:hypothetical protein